METEANNRRVYNGERTLMPTDLIEGEPIAERIVRVSAEIREGWTAHDWEVRRVYRPAERNEREAIIPRENLAAFIRCDGDAVSVLDKRNKSGRRVKYGRARK